MFGQAIVPPRQAVAYGPGQYLRERYRRGPWSPKKRTRRAPSHPTTRGRHAWFPTTRKDRNAPHAGHRRTVLRPGSRPSEAGGESSATARRIFLAPQRSRDRTTSTFDIARWTTGPATGRSSKEMPRDDVPERQGQARRTPGAEARHGGRASDRGDTLNGPPRRVCEQGPHPGKARPGLDLPCPEKPQRVSVRGAARAAGPQRLTRQQPLGFAPWPRPRSSSPRHPSSPAKPGPPPSKPDFTTGLRWCRVPADRSPHRSAVVSGTRRPISTSLCSGVGYPQTVLKIGSERHKTPAADHATSR